MKATLLKLGLSDTCLLGWSCTLREKQVECIWSQIARPDWQKVGFPEAGLSCKSPVDGNNAVLRSRIACG